MLGCKFVHILKKKKHIYLKEIMSACDHISENFTWFA